MHQWIYSIGSVVLVSSVSLVGIFTLSLNQDVLKKILIYVVSFAIGGLFGDTFLELLPEAYKVIPDPLRIAWLVFAGIAAFFVLEKFINWSVTHGPRNSSVKPYVPIIFAGDLFHNFIDGIILGASFTVNSGVGFATALAVIMHETPHEIGDFSAFVHGGLSPKRALFYNFSTALLSVLGAVISLVIGNVNEGFRTALLPITAGGFIYLAGSDLIPELKTEHNVWKSLGQFICIVAGFGLIALLAYLHLGE